MSKIAAKKKASGGGKGKPTNKSPKSKVSNVKLANKAGKNKFNKGKSFGGPRYAKKDKKK